MKTKMNRYTKSAFALLLACCMLMSCVLQSGAAQVGSEEVGASSTYTVYFRNNGNWSNVYVLTGSNLNMDGSSGAYKNLYGSNINSFTAMSLVPGETNVYKASVTVTNNKIAFASANSTQSGYYASSGQICCVGNMSSGKVVNMWTDNWESQNGAAYKKYNLEDYAPPTPNITGISSDWTNGDAMTFDSGNDYYYSFNGDGTDKYFRFKFSGKYYEAYDDGFNLETDGTYKPYDGTTSDKKYGTKEGDSNAFKLTASSGYTYKVYFDIDGKKAWFVKTALSYSVSLGTVSNGSITRSSTTAAYGSTVTLTTSPSTGYNDVKPTVTKAGGGTVTVTKTAANKYTFTMPDQAVTVTASFTIKSYDITFSQPTNGSITVNDSSTSPVSVNHGSNASIVVTPSAGYKIKTLTDNGNAVSAAVGQTSAYTYAINSVTAAHTIVATMESANTPLSAPATVTLNGSAANCSVEATTVGAKIRLAWSTVTNAGSYTVYKGSTAVATGVTSLYYDIERGASYSGDYSVVAVPSNTSMYSNSPQSTARTLTVSKKKLTKPTVTVSPTAIALGQSTNLTATDANSGVTAGQYYLYYYESSLSATDTYKLTSGTAKSITPATAGAHTYKVVAYPVGGANNDYYTTSDAASASTVTVYTPSFYLVGDLVDSTNNKWNTSLQDYPLDTFVSANVFKRIVTYTSGGAEDKHYFRLNDGTNQYTVTKDTDTDMSSHTTSLTAVTASTVTTSGAMYVKGQGTFTIYVNQSSKKVWVEKTEPQKYTTIVYVNKDSVATNMYVWKDANNAVSAWPGEDITTTEETVNDITYYKYTFESYWDHFDIVVNKGNGNNQSADLTNIAASKTYYVIWDGGANTTASISETAPVLQLGYKIGDNGTVTHTNFSNRSVSVSLAANTTYHFWLKSTNSHLNDQGNGTMSRENCSNWSFPVNETDTKIQTDLAGTYTFTYTVSNGNISVSVTYPPEPKYNVTVNQGDHGTVKVNGSSFTSGGTVQVGPLTTATVQAVAASGYHFTGWTTTGGVAAVSGYTTSSNPITISASAVGTITANYAEDSYTLTLASSDNGSITAPSSKTLTVHPFTATSLSGVTVSPANGYKFNGWTAGTGVTLTGGSTSSASAGTVKATQNSTLTAKFTKVSYALTGNVKLDGNDITNGGTVTFYSNAACTTQITTAKIGDTVYAKYTPTSYALVDFTLSGTGAVKGTTTNNVLQFTMGYSAATVTANVRVLKSVTYYVDMHNNSMTGKTVELAVVSGTSGSVTVLKDSNNQDCKATLTQQGSSTVYAATIATPVTKSGPIYSNVYLRVKYGNDTKYLTIAGANEVTNYIMSDSVTNPEMWIEARNEAGITYKVTYATNSTNISVASGKKRIYVAKPYDWQDDEPAWKHLHLYHWGNYADIVWQNAPSMNYIGADSNYHYYCIDVDSAVNNIIFQGWKDNSTYPDVQTGNIENIGSSNFFILSKDGNSYDATKGENAMAPAYTRYVSHVDMNVDDTANIAPTHTGAKVTYSSSNNAAVTVDSSGNITAVSSTYGASDVTITVKVFGTVGAKVTDAGYDFMTYTVSVTVRNPGIFNGYNKMSFSHQEYTVEIPKVDNNQPGYFVPDGTIVTVNGLYDGSGYTASYTNSAIITPTTTTSVSDVGNVPTAFMVKYAASYGSYSNISLNDATIITKSIRRTGGQRYGFKQWNPAQASATSSTVNDNGVETVTHKGVTFTAGTATYQAIFESYDYVDVTFTFCYEEYIPRVVVETVDGVQRTLTNYQYEEAWAAQSGAHITKTHTVTDFEVRNQTTSTITSANLVAPAVMAIEALPASNYYNYKIESSGVTIDSRGNYQATVTVNLTKSLREYSVYVNGTLLGSSYSYQEYAEPTVNTASNWYAVSSSADTNTSNAALLASGVTSYKFRVKGNTYLRTAAGTVVDTAFNRSEVGFSHYEITHRDNAQSQNVEYVLQNFYIADFFDKEKVMDLTRNDGTKGDDPTFVGGGVVYYSVTGGIPYAKAVDAGYVNSSGTIDEAEVKAMLKRNIEAKYNSTLADAIGQDDAMKVAYGTAIPVTNNTENGAKTGVMYRYLPLENYAVDANNVITTTPNSDVFRYSNSLQSYQYVYASGNENKATNDGKNMRLYSYYVYSYVAYNKDTNLPETHYEIVLSDQYSDASTYWAGNSNN